MFYSEHLLLLLYREIVTYFYEKGIYSYPFIQGQLRIAILGFPTEAYLVTSVCPGGFPTPGGLWGLSCRGTLGPRPHGSHPLPVTED